MFFSIVSRHRNRLYVTMCRRRNRATCNANIERLITFSFHRSSSKMTTLTSICIRCDRIDFDRFIKFIYSDSSDVTSATATTHRMPKPLFFFCLFLPMFRNLFRSIIFVNKKCRYRLAFSFRFESFYFR